MTSSLKRLQKLEQALTPRETMLLFLQEAHRYSSIEALVEVYKGKPVAEYPLSRLHGRSSPLEVKSSNCSCALSPQEVGIGQNEEQGARGKQVALLFARRAQTGA